MNSSTSSGRSEIATQVILVGLASVLLLWGLGDKYLWQDEAATAVLATRLLKFGKPLAYDGVNLISIDYFATEDPDTIAKRTADPKAAVDYYVNRGDLKRDTTWKWQPWGQFIVAAAGIGLLGRTTVGARLPFALAGVATVLLLYRLVRRYCSSRAMAAISALLLTLNAYWILHTRQCRYYSLSSLLLVVTVMAYLRWQDGERWGGATFVLAAWCWFQVDYGTIWPVFGVLFLDSLLARRRSFTQTILAGLGLAASMAPFLFYYEVWGRHMEPVRSPQEIFLITLFNTNEYMVPLVILLAAAALVAWRWNSLDVAERHLVAISCAVLPALLFWVPAATPEAFLRYMIMAAPLAAIVGAWVLVRGLGPRMGRFAWAGALVLVLTPWLSLPGRLLVPDYDRYETRNLWRSELPMMISEVFGHRPDPNRMTVDWLRQNAAPSDEILANYEDLPLMYYLPNPIRGGITAFRAEDDAKSPPRFLVIRHSVEFVHKPVFEREENRYKWDPIAVKIPDIIWGNNPDPMMWEQYPDRMTYLTLARRR